MSVTSNSLMISAHQKGVTPLNIVLAGTSFNTALRTNTFIPTGGVIKLISVTTTTTIPNHTMSKPRLCTNGKKIGTVSNSIDKLSNTIPNII